MKYDVSFTKAVASGNDFIIIDNKDGRYSGRDLDYSAMAVDLCRRNRSVGADGILVLEDTTDSDYRMRVINPDGSEVTMCGNGARCGALYAAVKGWGEDLVFETGAGILRASVKNGSVKINMGDPSDIRLDISLGVGKTMLNVASINTGVPHAVHVVEDLDNYPVREIGRKIREHQFFAPEGTNADFVQVTEEKVIRLRTYERGVEDETLACGTGAVASAVIMGILGYSGTPAEVLTKSGETLMVHYGLFDKKVTDVYLEGSADIVYEGRV